MNGDKPRICEKCGSAFHGDEPCVLSHVDLSDRGWLQRADREINDLALNTLRLYGISDEDEIQRLYSLDLNMQLFSIVLALESEATMKGGVKEALAGKVILDLGCGARGSLDPGKPRVREPWLCRVLHEIGAQVTGIDIGFPPRGQNSGEQFITLPADISDPKKLEMELPQKGIFDVVTSSGFFEISEGLYYLTSPTLIRHFRTDVDDKIIVAWFERELLVQVTRLLREGGWFIADRNFYRKINGSLKIIANKDKDRDWIGIVEKSNREMA